jgi:hypothetical protein
MTDKTGEPATYQDFCHGCKSKQPCKIIHHRSGTETLCTVCNYQMDFEIAEQFEDDYSEPVGSCENCGTNLYEEDDPELCDQCLWRSQGGM